MTYLTRNDTEETRFFERIAQQRKDHEAALDRLESKLQTLQQRREAREDRREARHAATAPRRQTPIPATAFPFQPAPALRATG
jgi:ferric-dicitrate binding protein FerR (iron transport regulator)